MMVAPSSSSSSHHNQADRLDAGPSTSSSSEAAPPPSATFSTSNGAGAPSSYLLPQQAPMSPFSSTPFLGRSSSSSSASPSRNQFFDSKPSQDSDGSRSQERPSQLPVPGIHLGSFKGIRMEDFEGEGDAVNEPSSSFPVRTPPSQNRPLRSPTSPTSVRPFYTSPSSASNSLPSPRDSAAVSRRKTVGASVVAASNQQVLAKGEGGQLMRGLGIVDTGEGDYEEDGDLGGGSLTRESSTGTSANGSGGFFEQSSRSPPLRRSNKDEVLSGEYDSPPGTFGSRKKKQTSMPSPSSSAPPPLPSSNSSSSSRSQSHLLNSNRPSPPPSFNNPVPPLPKPPQFSPSVLNSSAPSPSPPMTTEPQTITNYTDRRTTTSSPTPYDGEGTPSIDAEPVNRAGVGSRHLFSPTSSSFPAGTFPPHPLDPNLSSRLSSGDNRYSTSSPTPQPPPLVTRLSTGSRSSSRALPQPPPPTSSSPNPDPTFATSPAPPPPPPTVPHQPTHSGFQPPTPQQKQYQQQQRESQRMPIPVQERRDPLAAYIPGLAHELGPYPSPRRSMDPWSGGVEGLPGGGAGAQRQSGVGGVGVAVGSGAGGIQPGRSSMAGQRQEEVCLECLTRDRDLITVDVSSPGIWARHSDADFDDLLQRERAGEDVTESLKGGRKWEGGGPVGMGMVVGLEGSKRRTLKGHRLTEAALKEWTLKNPPASTHRFQTLQVYLLSQSQLLDTEATSRASTSIESRILSTKMRDTFATLRRESGAPVDPPSGGVRIRSLRPVEGGKETIMLESGIVVETVDLKRAEKERRKSGSSSRNWLPGGAGPSPPVPRQQRSSTTPANLPSSQRVSSGSTVFLPSSYNSDQQPANGDLSHLRPTASYSAFQDQRQMSNPSPINQVVRPFSFAVWAGRGRSASAGNGGGDSGSLKDGAGGRGGIFKGRFRGSERGWGGSQASDATGGGRSFWGGSGSMMDMHLGLDRDKEQREMARFSKPYQAAASTDGLNRPWVQSDQYSIAGSSTLQFEPQSEPASPTALTNGVQSMPKKKKKGIKAFFSKIGGGSTKSTSSFGNSPQVPQQRFDDDINSPLPPPPSLSFLSRSGRNSPTGGGGGGANSRESTSSRPRSSSSVSSSQSANNPLYPPSLSAGSLNYPHQQNRSASSPVGNQSFLPSQHGPTPSLSPSTGSASSPSASSIRFPARRGSRDTMGSRKSTLNIDSSETNAAGTPFIRSSLASSPGELGEGKRKSLGDGLNGLAELGLVRDAHGMYGGEEGQTMTTIPRSTTIPLKQSPQQVGGAAGSYHSPQQHHLQQHQYQQPSGPAAFYASHASAPPSSVNAQSLSGRPSLGAPLHQHTSSSSSGQSRRLSLYKDLPPLPPGDPSSSPSSGLASSAHIQPQSHHHQPSFFSGQPLSRPQSHQLPSSPRNTSNPSNQPQPSPRPYTYFQGAPPPGSSPHGQQPGDGYMVAERLQRGWEDSDRSLGRGTHGKEKKNTRGKIIGFFGVGAGKKDKMGEATMDSTGERRKASSDLEAISRAITRDEQDFAAYRYPTKEPTFEPDQRR